jgi:hypothetical protein
MEDRSMLRSIVYTSAAWRDIEAQCRAASNRETGWRQLGLRVASDMEACTYVDLVTFAVVGEGPGADATASHFTPDTEFQQAEIDRLVAQHPTWQFVAEGHLHPPSLSVPSGHDIRMAAEMAREPCYRLPNATMPIVIATLQHGHLRLRAFSVNASVEPPEVFEIPVLVDGYPQPELPPSVRMERRSIVGSLIRRFMK